MDIWGFVGTFVYCTAGVGIGVGVGVGVGFVVDTWDGQSTSVLESGHSVRNIQ